MKHLHPSLEEWKIRKGTAGVTIVTVGDHPEDVCDMVNYGEGLNGMARAELIRLAPRCRKNLDGLFLVFRQMLKSKMTDAEFRRQVEVTLDALEGDHINPKGRQPYP